MSFKHHKQMSESFLTAAFLSVSGGLQDAYTYIFRGKVFANAQTGNIVLMSGYFFDGDFHKGLHYLIPAEPKHYRERLCPGDPLPCASFVFCPGHRHR